MVLGMNNENDQQREERVLSQRLMSIVNSEMTERDINDLLIHSNSWEILYNLSPIRQNIVRWYPFQKDCTMLEIGAECGAVTTFLCSVAKTVVAQECSEFKAKVNEHRNQHYENLCVRIGSFENMEFETGFDYIFMIGIEEKLTSQTLQKIKSLLNSDGRFFLAIDNKIGIKKLACVSTDAQLQEYGVMKKELEQLLINAGFSRFDFYYPTPDYRLPAEIYSDDFLPDANSFVYSSPCYQEKMVSVIDEVKLAKDICENKLFQEHANSFLVVCE